MVERLLEHESHRIAVREKDTESVHPHHAVPRLGRTVVQGGVAEPSTADPGHMQEHVESSTQNIDGKLK